VHRFLRWLPRARARGASPAHGQRRFTLLRLQFNVVLSHTIQGTFCDPFYGGNANFVGWDLIGYPGVRLTATANDQRMDVAPAPTHMSAYDFSMFSRKKPDAR